MDQKNFLKAVSHATFPKYVTASESCKLIGTIDGRFPDFGHHLEKEMGGLWMPPIKLLDGFWLRLHDKQAENTNVWLIADRYEAEPWGSSFYYNSNLGHTTLQVTQRQVCPEEATGVLVEYEVYNAGHKACEVNLEWLARTNLIPVWFSETIGMQSGGLDQAQWLGAENTYLVKDPANDWFAAVGSDVPPDATESGQFFGPEITSGDGVSLRFDFAFSVAPRERKKFRFYVAGSYQSREDCLTQLAALEAFGGFDSALAAKQARYEKIFAQTEITTGDAAFDNVLNWAKVHNDWLIVNAGPYGRGLTAGLPEYAWWFGCDNCYALQGVLALGDYQLTRDTLLLILEYSEKFNGNGRILHEATTSGACVNPGNTQETAHYIVMLWLYYEWTGDASLLEKAVPYLEKSMQWLEQHQTDGVLFPTGYGIIEIAGLNSRMIDTAVYMAEAYRCYANICMLVGKQEEAEKNTALAQTFVQAFNTEMWDEKEGLFCDAYTSVEEVLEKKAAILEKSNPANAEKAEALLNRTIAEKEKQGGGNSGWLLNHNWIINTPMEMGIADKAKAERALEKMHSADFIGPYGMYLSGVYQTEMMTISTGAMAVAQARYGHPERALELVEKIFKTFGMGTPGGIAEMSPDYGCFVQGWTVYAVFVPLVRYFFGVQPTVENGTAMLEINPCMPAQWNHAEMKNTRVLDGNLSIHFCRENGLNTYTGECSVTKPVYYCLPAGKAATVNGIAYGKSENIQRIKLETGSFTIINE